MYLPQNPEKVIVISAMMVDRLLKHFGFHCPIAWHPLTPSDQKGKSEAIGIGDTLVVIDHKLIAQANGFGNPAKAVCASHRPARQMTLTKLWRSSIVVANLHALGDL